MIIAILVMMFVTNIAIVVRFYQQEKSIESLMDNYVEVSDKMEDELERIERSLNKIEDEKIIEKNKPLLEEYVKLMKYKGYRASHRNRYPNYSSEVSYIFDTGEVGISIYDVDTIEVHLLNSEFQKEYKKVLELKEKLCDTKCGKKGAKK